MKIVSLFLLEIFAAAVKGQIESFGLKAGQLPSAGSDVMLQCTASNSASAIAISLEDIATILTICSPKESSCIPDKMNRYSFEHIDASVYINIKNLQRDLDEKIWICSVNNQRTDFKLTVYTIPSTVSLISPDTCDLTTSQCHFTCKTDGCTYPEPELVWLYSQNNGNATKRMFGSFEQPSTARQDSCSSQEKIYSRTIKFPRYSTSPDIARKTIKLQCMIQFPNVANELRSGFSGNVQFAVMVSNVTIYYGKVVLKAGDQLTVRESQEETLRCKPGYGRPLPSVKWFIGEKQKSIGESFSFFPTNSIHNKNVYCKAYNIPPRELESVKVALYVKVKIKNVYLEPARDHLLSVIENTTEPVVCITSGGRPEATIKWLKTNSGQDLGPSDFIEYEITNENFSITKATKNVMASRQDKGWILTCEAWNTDKVETIKANNSKSFNILYPPEEMDILYSDERVTGAVIDVVRGTNVSFKCTAACNPPVESFFWSMRGVKLEGEIVTIENIRNNQTVHCTASNTMTSTSGHTEQGSRSITKEINVLHQATITRFAVLRIGKTESKDTLTVNENALMSIVCDVDSNPGSNIRLKQSRKLLAERQNSHTLEYNICSARCSHNGEYTCTAWNKINTDARAAERRLQINVRCSPILAEETDTTVIGLPNKSTVLSVTVIAFPMPTHYNWFKNTSSGWQEVTNSSDIEITHTALEFNLKVRKVRDEDYGIYNLTVDNGIGHPSGFLLVLQAQEEPMRQSNTPDNGSMAGIIGGVIGGLLLAGLVSAVLCILRKRNCFDATGPFRRQINLMEWNTNKSTFYALKKDTCTRRSLLRKKQSICYNQRLKAPVSRVKINLFGSKSKISREVTASKIDEGTGYENLSILTDMSMTANQSNKEKAQNVKETNLTSQSYGGLKDADIVFSDQKASTSSKKKNNNGGQTKRTASQMEEESGNEREHRAEPVAYEELGGTREQSHVYKTLQQDTRVRAQDSTYEGIDSRHRQDHTYESMH